MSYYDIHIDMTAQTKFLDHRIKALETELERLNNQNEFLNAKIDMLEIALDEAYLFI